jgi:hypothetical protein
MVGPIVRTGREINENLSTKVRIKLQVFYIGS